MIIKKMDNLKVNICNLCNKIEAQQKEYMYFESMNDVDFF